jgi:hypothetical protein
MSGAVKRISRDNLTQLVRLLGVEETQLLAASEHEVFATRADQASAITELLSSESVFAAAEHNGLYETLLRAVLHPGLSHYQRCVLYTRLLVVAAKQQKFEAARRYAALALESARANNDQDYQRAIWINLGTMEAEAGRLCEARRIFEAELDQLPDPARRHHHITVLVNLATLLSLMGQPAAALDRIMAADRMTREGSRGLQRFNTLMTLGEIQLECCNYSAARVAWQELLVLEVQPPQLRRRAEVRLKLLLLDALEGSAAAAASGVEPLLRELSGFDYFSQPPQRIAAQIYRLSGKLELARSLLVDALGQTATRSYEVPLIIMEQAALERQAGETQRSERLAARARRLMRSFGIERREVCST